GTAPNVTYTPASGFSGQDSFTFQAFDQSVGSNVASVTIQVVLPGTGISKVGQATNACSGGACTALSVSYSPVTGNSVLFFLWFDFAHAVTGVSVKDSKGNALTSDQTFAGAACSTNFACMQVWRQATVPVGVTGYSVNWTNFDNARAVVVEYSGLGPYDASVF